MEPAVAEGQSVTGSGLFAAALHEPIRRKVRCVTPARGILVTAAPPGYVQRPPAAGGLALRAMPPDGSNPPDPSLREPAGACGALPPPRPGASSIAHLRGCR